MDDMRERVPVGDVLGILGALHHEGRSGRPRSAPNAASNDRVRRERCARASWVADHQQGWAVRRIDKALALKAGLGIGADRAAIVGVRIRYDARNSRSQQGGRELPEESLSART